VKKLHLTRMSGFLLLLTLGVVRYLLACLLHFKEHPDLPWYETGTHASIRDFPVTIALFVAAFAWLIFRKDT
jgi:hypothetical protein